MGRVFVAFVFFIALGSFCFSQVEQPAHKDQPAKPFGHSLERYKNKKSEKRPPKKPSVTASTEAIKSNADDETIRVNTELVLANYLVTDQKGQIVYGLNADDFQVSENDVRQDVEVIRTGQVNEFPRTIVLILEISIADKHRLSKSFTAARKLIAKLGPNDRIGIVTTDQRLRLPLTLDKQLAQNILSQLSSHADSDESWMAYNADFGTLLAVLNEMFSNADGERIVICQCDGSEASWLKRDGSFRVLPRAAIEASGAWRYSKNRAKLFSEYSYADVSQSAIFSRVSIYPIVPGIRFLGFDEKERLRRSRLVWNSLIEANKWRDYQVTQENLYARMESETLGQEMLKSLADLSGGNMGFIEKAEDADRVYDELFQVMEARYLIGYYPKEPGKPGERRRIKVEVKGRPDLTVHGRTEYIVR